MTFSHWVIKTGKVVLGSHFPFWTVNKGDKTFVGGFKTLNASVGNPVLLEKFSTL